MFFEMSCYYTLLDGIHFPHFPVSEGYHTTCTDTSFSGSLTKHQCLALHLDNYNPQSKKFKTLGSLLSFFRKNYHKCCEDKFLKVFFLFLLNCKVLGKIIGLRGFLGDRRPNYDGAWCWNNLKAKVIAGKPAHMPQPVNKNKISWGTDPEEQGW